MESGRKKRQSFAANLFLIVISVLVTILIAEGGTRLFYYIRWNGHLYKLNGLEYSLRLGWMTSPGLYTEFQINDQNFRRPQNIPLVPPSGTIRIMLVGGSTAFGANGLYPQFEPKPLRYEDTIDYQLEAMLAAENGGVRFEVINAAVSEYRLFQEITLFQDKLVNFRPDLVIFLDGHNDISFLTGVSALTHDGTPYWSSRHFDRGQRVLNDTSVLAPLNYLDLYLGRVSYFYHGLSRLFQHYQDVRALTEPGSGTGPWGEGIFKLEDEKLLLQKYKDRLGQVDQALPLYVQFVHDLKALAASRHISVVYMLQPEIVVESPSDLSAKEAQIQQFAFQHHHEFGTLAWRHLTGKLASSLDDLSNAQFQFIDSTVISKNESEDLYTDYCHLTARGNRVIAQRLYPVVVALAGMQPAAPKANGL